MMNRQSYVIRVVQWSVKIVVIDIRPLLQDIIEFVAPNKCRLFNRLTVLYPS